MTAPRSTATSATTSATSSATTSGVSTAAAATVASAATPAASATAGPPQPFSVCVYCGSRNGARPAYRALARALGQGIGRRGWQLVYGGGRAGLMGEVADATLAAGGRVVGIIPDTLMRLEVGHAGLHELHVVQTMHQRKQMMAERADAFVAMPGGIGTFEELFEVWTWRHLAYHDRPIALLDAEGYWTPLQRFLERSVAEGFMDAGQMAMLQVHDQVDALLDGLRAEAGIREDDDFGRI